MGVCVCVCGGIGKGGQTYHVNEQFAFAVLLGSIGFLVLVLHVLRALALFAHAAGEGEAGGRGGGSKGGRSLGLFDGRSKFCQATRPATTTTLALSLCVVYKGGVNVNVPVCK